MTRRCEVLNRASSSLPVYSYLSRTTREGSNPTRSAAVQFGLGLGAQF